MKAAARILTAIGTVGLIVGSGQLTASGPLGIYGIVEKVVFEPETGPPYIIENSPGRPRTDLRVRPAGEAPTAPALYQTHVGVVNIPDEGSHAAIVQQLKAALKQERAPE